VQISSAPQTDESTAVSQALPARPFMGWVDKTPDEIVADINQCLMICMPRLPSCLWLPYKRYYLIAPSRHPANMMRGYRGKRKVRRPERFTWSVGRTYDGR
jgi:hypothetical protein